MNCLPFLGGREVTSTLGPAGLATATEASDPKN